MRKKLCKNFDIFFDKWKQFCSSIIVTFLTFFLLKEAINNDTIFFKLFSPMNEMEKKIFFCYNRWLLWFSDEKYSRSDEFRIRQKQLESRKVLSEFTSLLDTEFRNSSIANFTLPAKPSSKHPLNHFYEKIIFIRTLTVESQKLGIERSTRKK